METDWKSIYIATFTAFLLNFRIATISANLWPYMKLIDHDVRESFFGSISSLENLGNLIMSFVAGVLCNKLKDAKLCTLVGILFYITSSLIYLSVEAFPTSNRLLFTVMEAFLGFGVGFCSVSRTHVAMASNEEDRPRAMSIYALAYSIGLGAGPVITLIGALLPYPGITYIFGLHLNIYTAPPLLFLTTSIFAFLLFLFIYDGTLKVQPISTLDVVVEPKKVPEDMEGATYDKFAVVLCCLTRMIKSSSLLFLINVGGPYMMTAFGWSSEQLVVANAILFTGFGVFGVAIGISYMTHFTQRHLSDRRGVVLSMAMLLAFYLITYPYPFYKTTIPYEIIENGTIISHGCSERFHWCASTPAVNQFLYFITMIILISIGIPLLMLNLDILYSKVLGNIRQGTMQGVFLVCGEFTNIVGPIVLSEVYEATGPIYLWQFNIVTISVVMLVWVVYYDRMISATRREKQRLEKSCDMTVVGHWIL